MIPPEWPTCFSSEGVMRDEYRLPWQGRQGAAGSTTGNPGRHKGYRGKQRKHAAGGWWLPSSALAGFAMVTPSPLCCPPATGETTPLTVLSSPEITSPWDTRFQRRGCGATSGGGEPAPPSMSLLKRSIAVCPTARVS